MIRLDLPFTKPPLTQNQLRRMHHYTEAREKADALAVVRSTIRAAGIGPVPWGGANVTLHYQPATKRRYDADGLAPTLKVCLDALVLQGVLADDSWVEVPCAAIQTHQPEKPPAMWLTLTNPKEN